MATHSSVLAWRIPGTGEPGGLPSMGSHRVRHGWSNLAAAAGFSGGSVVKTPPAKAGDSRDVGSIWKILWRRKWQPTPVFLPGKFHGQRNLVGYSSWACKELDMTEWLSTHTGKTLRQYYESQNCNYWKQFLYVTWQQTLGLFHICKNSSKVEHIPILLLYKQIHLVGLGHIK